ncbi:hypothetical protein [Actinoplanes utahensis]|uniref:Uncharacterized protein n=1 Tax=Actinoplanes utahensis TaxID=1869 RepID=A0A0A6UC91_ACTUT|nr:hypothetical protein [Actinoplanes utahensis]KHD72693.1 hypothetical protein MB27_40470 [Actinoplanes utahensis]GIF29148.1 hypothetical protein Aut01nite_21340 [Actinoplanes utahensis]
MPEARDSSGTWLGNVDYTDFGAIEADIAAMEQFAAQLKADIQNNFAPYAEAVSTTMTEPLPETTYYDLHLFLYSHDQAQIATQMNVAVYTDGTYQFADAASGISRQYRGSDAFSSAKLSDVEAAFKSTAPSLNPADIRSGTGTSGSGTGTGETFTEIPSSGGA